MREFASDAAGQREQLREEREARGEGRLPAAEEWCVVAYRLDAAGFPGGAAEAWRAALGAREGMPLAHLGLGRALLDLGDAEGAAGCFRAALEADAVAAERGLEPLLDDPDEDPWYPLGLAEHMRGRFDAAVEAYGRAAERFPWFAEPLLERARAELARGNRPGAEEACRGAVARARGRPELAAEAERILADGPGPQGVSG